MPTAPDPQQCGCSIITEPQHQQHHIPAGRGTIQSGMDDMNTTASAPDACGSHSNGASLNPFCKDVALMTTIYVCMRLLWGVMAVSGNILTILAVVRFTHLRTLTNAFILSLASADLINGLLAAPLLAAEEFLRGSSHWRALCLIFNFFTLLTAGCNMANICAISVERYIYIHHPLTYYHIVTPCRVASAIAVIWTSVALEVAIALVFALPFDNRTVCDARVILEVTVYYFLVICNFVLPSLVTLCMYARITVTARRHQRQIVNVVRPTNSHISHNDFEMTERSYGDVSRSNADVAIHSESEQGQDREALEDGPRKTTGPVVNDQTTTEAWVTPVGKCRPPKSSPTKVTVTKTTSNAREGSLSGQGKQRGSLDAPMNSQQMRVTKVLGLVLGLYLLLNLPAIIISPFVQHLSDDTGEVIRVTTLLLLYANSWANPLLYAWKAQDFRRAFAKLLRFRD